MDQTELRELENRCIQECSPWCASSCPIHVDVRSMCAAISKGDFDTAVSVILKTVPFPRIISRICDRPCESSCKRNQSGQPIEIRALEKVALSFGSARKTKTRPIPAKGVRVAVVGAGLGGLTAAFDLVKKGYEVSVFDAQDLIGGRVREFLGRDLPEQDMEKDFEALDDPKLSICFNQKLGADFSINDLKDDFKAIYLGIGKKRFEDSKLTELLTSVTIDPLTFSTQIDGLFAGGSLLRPERIYSPITSISDGRRAAISIDRFIQGVSLTASRVNEGQYHTRLFTNMEGIDPSSRIPLKDRLQGYTQSESISEASRCLQCECMECVKVCEFLSTFGGYPRKYVRQIYNNLSIVMGQRHGNKLTNSCSLCGLCEEVCPEDLNMGEVCKSGRQIMTQQGKMPPSAHEFALQDMDFVSGEECSFVRHQPSMTSSAYVFFPGCRLAGTSPKNVERTYKYLTESLHGGVGFMLNCCGAPADWAGRKDISSQHMFSLHSQWVEMGQPTLITACSSCHSLFREAMPEMKLLSLWEVLANNALPPIPDEVSGLTLCVHDPCSSRHEPQVQQAVRNILGKLGVKIEELPLHGRLTECCGYGGLMCFANRDLSIRVMKRRIEMSDHDYLAYCAVCKDHFLSQGKKTFHLLDIIFGGHEDDESFKRPVNFSLIRERRRFLKSSMLKTFWNEQAPCRRDSDMINLYISPEIRDLMCERMILEDDLRTVIDHVQKTGRKLLNKSNGHFLAHHTPSKVTYWVEFSPFEDGFAIHNAYSHRMQVVEETGQ